MSPITGIILEPHRFLSPIQKTFKFFPKRCRSPVITDGSRRKTFLQKDEK